MNYAVVGTITDMSINDITPWVHSLDATNFTGKRLVIVYDVHDDVKRFLIGNGFELYQSSLNPNWRTHNAIHLYNQRFRDMALLLSNYDVDRIIWTDVRDVIFQKDPSIWLENNQKNHILACSEAVKLGDDDWATVNAGTSFPLEWEWLQYEESFCAGCILGDRRYIIDLFHNIYRWGITGANPAQAADQPSYNILIKQQQFRNIVQYVKQEEALAIQMGTTYIKKDFFGSKLLEPTPIISNDGTVTNQQGEPFHIVHQYDRDPKLKHQILRKYT
jgi:hypothetical protein